MNAVVKVVCRDGEVGILQEVIVSPLTLQPTYLIVSRAMDPTQTLRVHIHSIREISEHQIMLNKTMESLDFLTHYQINNPVTA